MGCHVLLENAMAPHSSTLAWKIPWTEKPGRLQSMGLLRVRHDWATSLSLFTFMHWRRKWQPTPVFLPGESQGRGSLVAAIYGVAQSRTRLKQLSSSSSHALLQGIFLTQGSNSVSYVSSTAGRLAPLGKTVFSDFTASQSNPAMCSECLYFLHYSKFQFFKVAGNNLLLGKEHFIF